jgi:Domain of unknown function (DUF1931)
MRPTGISKLERFFREAASLVKRYEEFVTLKIGDLLLRGDANARANGRDIIQSHDLPITKGLQECIHVFEHLDKDIGLSGRRSGRRRTRKRSSRCALCEHERENRVG